MVTPESPRAAFPTIRTNRLVLRELTEADTPAVFRNFADPAVVEFIMRPVSGEAEARRFIDEWRDGYRRRTALVWAVDCQPGCELVGTCGYETIDWTSRRGEIGYDLAPDQWGKGLMTEALQAVIEYGFHGLGLNRIEAHTLLANQRSVRLLLRLGFAQEGTLRERVRLADRFWDQGIFSLLGRDWLGSRASGEAEPMAP